MLQESPNNTMRNESRYAEMTGKTSFLAYECHFHALGEVAYYGAPNMVENYCICVWRVKAKLFDNTSNPES